MKEFTTPIISEILDKNIFNSLKKEVNEYIKNNKNEFQTAWRCPTLSNINSNKKFRTPLLENIIKNITENYFSLYKFNSYLNFLHPLLIMIICV